MLLLTCPEPLLLLLRPDLSISRLVALDKVLPEAKKCAVQDREPNLLHQPHDKPYIMYSSKTVSQKLLSLEQVMQISGREVTAGVAVTIGVDGPLLRFEAGIPYVIAAALSKDRAIAP